MAKFYSMLVILNCFKCPGVTDIVKNSEFIENKHVSKMYACYCQPYH